MSKTVKTVLIRYCVPCGHAFPQRSAEDDQEAGLLSWAATPRCPRCNGEHARIVDTASSMPAALARVRQLQALSGSRPAPQLAPGRQPSELACQHPSKLAC